jgi:hypothetical protein
MSNAVQRRERIARVRRVEHMQAAAAAAQAEAQLKSLQESAERVLSLRLSLTTGVGAIPAEYLAARGELAHRLDVARFGLADAIAGQRTVVDAKSAERVEARIRQESAERLVDRAQHDADVLAEKRQSARGGFRPSRFGGEEA